MCKKSSGESCNKLARVTPVSHATQTCRGLDTSNAERRALRERPTPRLCFHLSRRVLLHSSDACMCYTAHAPCLEISLNMRTQSLSFQHKEKPSCKKFRFFCSITPAAHTSVAMRNNSGLRKGHNAFKLCPHLQVDINTVPWKQ